MILILFIILVALVFATRSSLYSPDPEKYGTYETIYEGECVPSGMGTGWHSETGTKRVIQRCIPNPDTQFGCLVLNPESEANKSIHSNLFRGEYTTLATQFGTLPCEVAKVYSEWVVLSTTECGVDDTESDIVEGVHDVSRICTLVENESDEPNYCIDNDGVLYDVGDIWVNTESCFIETDNAQESAGTWMTVLPLSNKSPDFLGQRSPAACELSANIVPESNCVPYDNTWDEGPGGFFDVLKEGAIYNTMTCVVPSYVDDNGITIASMTYNGPTDECTPADSTDLKINPEQVVDGTLPDPTNPILFPSDAPSCLSFCRVVPVGCFNNPSRYDADPPFNCLVGCFLNIMKGNKMLRQIGEGDDAQWLFIAPVGDTYQTGYPLYLLIGPRSLTDETLTSSFIGIANGIILGWLKRVDIGGPEYRMGFEAIYDSVDSNGIKSQDAEQFDLIYDSFTQTYSLPIAASDGEQLDMFTITSFEEVEGAT